MRNKKVTLIFWLDDLLPVLVLDQVLQNVLDIRFHGVHNMHCILLYAWT